MEQISISFEPERRVFTVAEITGAIRGLLEQEFTGVWVSGEISGAKRAASGHLYFTLKDEDAQIQCACWRSAARMLRFQPQDGVAVLARGRVDVYPARGQYQLIVEAIEPQGYGALQLAFEQLKKKLEAEGLFEEAGKRTLPRYPRRIGVVTSPTGAAFRDIVHVLTRRFPGVHIRLYPALVQGEGSAPSIVEGIEHFGDSGWAEVLIVGRGGGSLEDLWAFNEEIVARAIADSPIPVISAVGHETDFTIADFVADLRAPTPSAAAELVVPERRELLERLETSRRKMAQSLRYRVSAARSRLYERGVERAMSLLRRRIGQYQQQVDEAGFRLRDEIRRTVDIRRRRWQQGEALLRRQDLRLRLAEVRRRLERSTVALAEGTRRRLVGTRMRLDPLGAQLHQLSPLRVLERGYSIVQDADGRVVKEAGQAPVGAGLAVRLHRGHLGVTVANSSTDEPDGA